MPSVLAQLPLATRIESRFHFSLIRDSKKTKNKILQHFLDSIYQCRPGIVDGCSNQYFGESNRPFWLGIESHLGWKEEKWKLVLFVDGRAMSYSSVDGTSEEKLVIRSSNLKYPTSSICALDYGRGDASEYSATIICGSAQHSHGRLLNSLTFAALDCLRGTKDTADVELAFLLLACGRESKWIIKWSSAVFC